MEQNTQQETLWQIILSYFRDVCQLLGVALLVLAFCIRGVVVSGDSMYDTLVDGDYLVLLETGICGELERGDIVVAAMDRFRDGTPIVKRVIATENQTVDIDFASGTVYVDGVALSEDYTYSPTDRNLGMEFPLTVEEGCLFLMGDNRGISDDSRDPLIGQVDTREILGKAVLLLFPGNDGGEIARDYSRIGGLGK